MKTSTMLRIYRMTSVVLLALLALMPLLFWRHIIFATFATTVITLVLIVIAFQVQRLRMLARTNAKLDELLELLRDTKRELSPTESKRLQQELAEIRARLLRDNSLKRPNR
jgi:low affinity Fe/Cu permease